MGEKWQSYFHALLFKRVVHGMRVIMIVRCLKAVRPRAFRWGMAAARRKINERLLALQFQTQCPRIFFPSRGKLCLAGLAHGGNRKFGLSVVCIQRLYNPWKWCVEGWVVSRRVFFVCVRTLILNIGAKIIDSDSFTSRTQNCLFRLRWKENCPNVCNRRVNSWFDAKNVWTKSPTVASKT